MQNYLPCLSFSFFITEYFCVSRCNLDLQNKSIRPESSIPLGKNFFYIISEKLIREGPLWKNTLPVFICFHIMILEPRELRIYWRCLTTKIFWTGTADITNKVFVFVNRYIYLIVITMETIFSLIFCQHFIDIGFCRRFIDFYNICYCSAI